MVEDIVIKNPLILLDHVNNEELATNGFATFPLLSEADIIRLSEYYFKFQKEEPNYFYSSTHSADTNFRKQTSDFIKNVIAPLLPGCLVNYRLLGGAFVVKPGNGKGILQPHQDWNLVDEERHRSYNLWIPLTDVNTENGAMFVLPRSHNICRTYRGPGIQSIFKAFENEVWSYLKPMPMKAGEALLYDHALLHGSPANLTDKIRLGIVIGIIEQDAQMQINALQGGKIEIYECDEHFFLFQDPMKDTKDLKKINKPAPQNIQLTIEGFRKLFIGAPEVLKNKLSTNFFNWLFAKLKH
jgi:hypothetical protein